MKIRLPLTIIIGFIAGMVIGGVMGDVILYVGAKVNSIRVAKAIKSADYLLSKDLNEKALEVYRSAAGKVSLKREPAKYAFVQNKEGIAYLKIAAASDTVSNVENAIASFRGALKVYLLSKYPLQYAETQNNLGNAYSILADIHDNGPNAAKAIKAYNEALKIYTPGEYPDENKTVLQNMARLKQKTLD